MSASRIRAMLVEDEVLARLALRQALASHPEVEIVGECGCGSEALEAVRVLDPDLIFLDIQMPGMDGFELLRALRAEEELPIVVFVTAFSKHALRAFDAQALDYLLKPLDQGRFDSAMERVKAQWRGRREGAATAPASLASPAGLGPGGGFLERVSVRKGERIRVLRVGEIDWIAAEGNYVRIHAGGAAFLHRETLSRMEASLDPARFLRIHRGTVVNLDRIKEVTPLFYGDYRLLLADGTPLTLSRRFRERARQALGLP
jgi:two-component system LytT family response regulator